MSENSHYPPDYWKIKNENALLIRQVDLIRQASGLLQVVDDLENERVALWRNDKMPQEPPLQITRKGECKLIQFVPVREN